MLKPMRYLFYIMLFACMPAFGQNDETISRDEARINDKITMTFSKAEFDRRFKKADSITTEDICGRAAKMLYYKGAKYELDGETMKFRSVDFSKNRNTYFSIENDWFDHTTTLKSFSRTYPASASFIEDADDTDGDILDMIVLLPAEANSDCEWRFFFKNEKLKSIECWVPCD